MKLFNPLLGDAGEVIGAHFTRDLDAHGWDVPDFLPAEVAAQLEKDAADAQEALDQAPYDADARRRRIAKEKDRREAEEAEISGHLAPDAELFRDLKLKPNVKEAHEYQPVMRTPVVQNLFYRNSLTWVAGQSGTFKSFVTADLAFRYGAGDMDYHGRRMTTGRALLVIAEGAAGYADRKTAWEKHHEREVKNVSIYPAPLQLGDTLKEMPALRSYLAEEDEAGRPFGLIVFDTQAMCTVGIDENSSEMNQITNVLHRLREVSGACVLVVHHFGKDPRSGMRGSSMIYAAADTVAILKRKEDEGTVLLSTAQVDGGKQKDGITEKDLLEFDMRAHPVGEDYFGDAVFSLVPVSIESAGHDAQAPVDDVPLSLPDVSERQMASLRLVAFYEHRGASAADMAERMIEESGPVKNARQNVRNRMIELAKLTPSLAEQPNPKGPWKITAMGVAVIARDLSLRQTWGERSTTRRRFGPSENQDPILVSPEVSKPAAKLDSETSET